MELRVFTLEAVNSMVPRLSSMVAKQLTRRSEIEALLVRLGKELGDVPERIVIDPADPTDIRDLKKDLVSRLEKYRTGWRGLEEMGAVLKEARMGLFDFYGKVDGRLVGFCWKNGERPGNPTH